MSRTRTSRLPDPSMTRPDRHDDQAASLRRLFARREAREVAFLPVIANPHVAAGGVLLERICTALGERGLSTLVVDAAETASEPHELAHVDLAACIEPLAADVRFLAARGLALASVDALGSARPFLRRLLDAAPDADAIVVHAGAADLCRLFGRTHRRVAGAATVARDPHDALAALDDEGRPPCPIAMADDGMASVTHAYASMKLLARRAGLAVTDLLLACDPALPRTARIACQLAACVEGFVGGASRRSACVDPSVDPHLLTSDDLRRLLDGQLGTGAARAPRGARAGAPAGSPLAAGRARYSPAGRAASIAYGRHAATAA
jgi:hypothetical protein